ncbi:AAA family ATPase [Radiobacillus kanasensis]|uniref:AAA family ATPase n=1 Tax=Radiobacillus kanasensis TaxID=2844358 RepID=UPI001E40978C|nr:AAA family ATPase [Radiobacillus kanasensis]UFU00424.1 AAA family ATPase [Radiobacillus kanasensis]
MARRPRRPQRIHIIGSVGSGKTTLAKELSKKLKIPHYELDQVVWNRTSHGDVRNSLSVRDEQFHRIIASDAWIVEGVHHEWIYDGLIKADIIVFLDVRMKTRRWRIWKRYMKQILRLEKSHYRASLRILRKMFVWNQQFEKESRPEILKILKAFSQKTWIVTSSEEIKKALLK